MFQKRQKHSLLLLAGILLVLDIFFLRLDWQNTHQGFTFAMLDVGQGDALFIESPSGVQILVDGGLPGKISGQLARVMSPFDRSIDAIVITNPDTDHLGGFLDVLKNYKVGEVLEPGTLSDSRTYQNLKNEIKNKKIPEILARKGMRLDLGGGVKLEILFPDRDVSAWATNDGSVVAKLSYGNFSATLTGDATKETEKIILSEFSPATLHSRILKVGHHGSRGSTSSRFLQAVSPAQAFISVGQNNRYSHPHPEVLNLLSQFGAKIYRTDRDGTVVVKCPKDNYCKISSQK